MNITFETEQETDGRWIAEVPELAGELAYGATEMEAVGKAEALALRVLAERTKHELPQNKKARTQVTFLGYKWFNA